MDLFDSSPETEEDDEKGINAISGSLISLDGRVSEIHVVEDSGSFQGPREFTNITQCVAVRCSADVEYPIAATWSVGH